jgi:hypothetical protein
MKLKTVAISEIKENPDNPRVIKDDDFKDLIESIKKFPKMLEIRPIVVNSEMMVLGGNQRLAACKAAGLKKLSVVYADDLTPDEQREFIIKDNVSKGSWDWDKLTAEWESDQLSGWGLDKPEWISDDKIDLDKFFDANDPDKIPDKNKVVLEFTSVQFVRFMEGIRELEGTKEEIILQLLDGQ